MAKRTNDLGNDPVPQLLWRLALPAVTAQVVNALYNIVDRMYLGHMKPDGDLAITGVGVAFAIACMALYLFKATRWDRERRPLRG